MVEAVNAGAGLDLMGDIHASADYRQHLAAVLSRRALEKALTRLPGEAGRSAA